uniref:Uncharacterized protein n=1 Tax=Pipistrellus kuhlii TaxID=59472 RepID=A0A7J7U867_PIPKU|nr:hypothetical protein mPipKuh1_009171 [Pipistrellus kuhlii]
MASSGASPPGPGVQAAEAEEEEEEEKEEEEEEEQEEEQEQEQQEREELRRQLPGPRWAGTGRLPVPPVGLGPGHGLAVASRPHLQLRVDVGRAGEDPLLDGWDVVSPADVPGPDALLPPPPAALAALLLLSQVGRTLSKVQQVLSWSSGREARPFQPPPGEAELRTYLDPEGRLSNPEQLRLRVYQGGVEPALHRAVWPHLLNRLPGGQQPRARAAEGRVEAAGLRPRGLRGVLGAATTAAPSTRGPGRAPTRGPCAPCSPLTPSPTRGWPAARA